MEYLWNIYGISMIQWSGWWLTYNSEKYESIGMTIPNIWKNKTCSKPPTRNAWFFKETSCEIPVAPLWWILSKSLCFDWGELPFEALLLQKLRELSFHFLADQWHLCLVGRKQSDLGRMGPLRDEEHDQSHDSLAFLSSPQGSDWSRVEKPCWSDGIPLVTRAIVPWKMKLSNLWLRIITIT